MEFANVELITFFYALGVDAVPLELDTICRIEILDVIGTIFKNDSTMLS